MSSRYQREIEEILESAGEVGPSKPRISRRRYGFFRLVWLYAKQSLSGGLWSITAGRVMLTGFLLLLSGLLLQVFGLGTIGLLAWVGLLVFIIGYGMVLARPPKIEKRWRGQLTDDPKESWFGRVRRRIKRG